MRYGRAPRRRRRLAFFQANPQWTQVAQLAISYSISFVRRYAEQGDYEVAGRALTAAVAINAAYVVAKGKTFFAPNPIFEIHRLTTEFIDKTLSRCGKHCKRPLLAEKSNRCVSC